MEQMTIWEYITKQTPKLTFLKKLRVIEMFAGIGSQMMSLRDIGADIDGEER